MGTSFEEVENHPFQGRKTVIQLNREQVVRCMTIHDTLSSQKKTQTMAFENGPIVDIDCRYLELRGKVAHKVVVLIDMSEN
jgi:hypothetical protein